MKKIKKNKFKWVMITIMLATLCSPFLTSCGDDEPGGKLTDELLVGTWTAYRDGIHMTLQFAPNHRGVSEAYGSNSWNDPFSWKIVSKNEILFWDDEIVIWIKDDTPYGQIRYRGRVYTKASSYYDSVYD